MRSLTLVLSALLVTASVVGVGTPVVAAQAKQPGNRIGGEKTPPPLLISDEDLDMGQVRPRTKFSKSVRLRNVGDETIAIVKTSSDCSCTALITDGVVEIKPGDDVVLDITVDTRDMGLLIKKIRVHCAGFTSPYEAVVRTNVTEAVEINRGGVKALLQPMGVLSLDSTDGRSFRVLSVQGAKPQFMDFDPASDEPRASYQVVYNLKPNAQGKYPAVVVIETDHPDAPMIAARHMSGQNGPAPTDGAESGAAQKFRSDYDFELVHSLQPGESVELPIRLSKAGVAALEETLLVSSDNPLLHAEVASLDTSDVKWMTAKVRVTASPEAEGFQAATLSITLGQARHAEVQVFARVESRTAEAAP